MKTILFRLDYGKSFGGGHLARCLILAKFLQKKYQVIFIIQNKDQKNLNSCKRLIRKELHKNIKIFFLKNFNFKNEFRLNHQLNINHKVSKVIFDFSNFEKVKVKSKLVTYFDKLSKINKNLFLIDSLGEEALTTKKKFKLSVLITPYLGAKKNNLYQKHYFGGSYFVMRVKNFKKKNEIKKKVKNILITCGQSDHKKITYRILKILCFQSNLFKDIKLNVVIGNDFEKKYIKQLINFKKKNFNKFKITFIKNCSDLSEYISTSDISLITTGLTKYECIFYKSVPIIISFDNLSHKLQKKFQAFKSSIYLGQIRYLKKTSLIYNMENLLKNYNLRKKIIKNGSKIFDGRGFERVIKILSYEKK